MPLINCIVCLGTGLIGLTVCGRCGGDGEEPQMNSQQQMENRPDNYPHPYTSLRY